MSVERDVKMPVERDVTMTLETLEREKTTLLQELKNSENFNVTLREQLDRVQSEYKTLTNENTFIRKKVASLQQEIVNNHNGISRIESELYQKEQEVERLKKENVGFLKNKRETERKLREETLAFEKDRQTWQEREGELTAQFKALQDTLNVLAQQSSPSDSSPKKHSHQSSSNGMMPTSSTSGFLNSSYHALSSLSARLSNRHTTDGTITREDSPPPSPTSLPNITREIKIAKNTIKEQDKFINQLNNEIERAKTATTDQINLNRSLSLRITLLETELEQVKRVKRSLEDVNEGFQLLLHEKTMKGDFMLNPIMQNYEANNSRQKLVDSLRELPTSNKDDGSRRREKKSRPKSLVTDLAAELSRASAGNVNNHLLGERVEKESDQIVDFEKLLEENKNLKDANTKLTNYLQKILGRIMEEEGFEQVLSTDWTKRAPSNPTTPTATTFSHIRTLSKPVNNPAVIVEESAAAANSTKKVERRKTLSGPFRALPNIKIPKSPITIQNIEENADQLSPLPTSSPVHSRTTSLTEEVSSTKLDSISVVEQEQQQPIRRPQRRNSSSDGGPRKRWSLWWSGNNNNGKQQTEVKKEDPHMRPMILVQESEKAK
ncbi:546_t:CDS:2 [Ambispora gerdemannii]|uniref:546_t:CDS:1 n=1 Tax=Ambispora gerdemannii TaxID=144530 RepID=A0A9N9C3W2_9GLOM|nr:546_t:CDS:2 [Ambispora gerdemannii]